MSASLKAIVTVEIAPQNVGQYTTWDALYTLTFKYFVYEEHVKKKEKSLNRK